MTGFIQELDNAETFEHDCKTQAAVTRYIDMRDMRNKMIHDYLDVNVNIVWNTVKEDLPRLKQQIDGLLADYRQKQQQRQQEQDLANEREQERER